MTATAGAPPPKWGRAARENALFVSLLAAAGSPQQRRRLVCAATNSNLRTLATLARDSGAAPTPYARQIAKMARRGMSLETRRRRVLNARAGFLPLLIKAAALALPAVLAKAIK